MNITNNTAKPLPITTGVTLAAGETRYIKDWAGIADGNPIIGAWIKERLISVAPRSSLDGLDLTDEARGMFGNHVLVDKPIPESERESVTTAGKRGKSRIGRLYPQK